MRHHPFSSARQTFILSPYMSEFDQLSLIELSVTAQLPGQFP